MPQEQTAPTTTNTKKLWIAAGVILLIGVSLQQYFMRTGGSGSLSASPRPGVPMEKISVKVSTDGWQEYANTKLGFSVKYPQQVTLRGNPESDLAILTLPKDDAGGKVVMVTLTKKKVPLGQAPYASMEEFWKDEQKQIAANNGVASNARYIELNGKTFWEAREDNRQNNYMGLHRYMKGGDAIFEVTLTVEGDKLFASAVDRYNGMLMTFALK